MLGIAPTSSPALPASPVVSIGGILPVVSAKQILEDAKRQAQLAQNQPVIQSLAAHVRRCWTSARDAKQATVEPEMHRALRQRRGEYDTETLQRIRQQGGSEIFMMLTSVKCRAASAWLKDTLLGARDEKPWTLAPSPVPTLPPDRVVELRQVATQQLAQLMLVTGQTPAPSQVRQLLTELRDEFMDRMDDEARKKCQRMEKKMEDQLAEGGFIHALDAFIDDLTTFPAAIIKGPVVRMRPQMQWVPGLGGQFTLDYKEDLALEWERVSPFDIYPSPNAESVDDGFLIERHRLRRADLVALQGVEGYDNDAIRLVLDELGEGGLHDWTAGDTERASAEGKSAGAVGDNDEGLIDALQFWGPVQGKMLLEWGVPETEIDDPLKEFNCEIWLIGSYVIKATLNYHPMGKKPYFKASYEQTPGAFWGNSVAGLCRDTQDMCNAAARALANNMGIASGPQVVMNVERLPDGEDIEQMYPWKIWQVKSDPLAGSAPAVDFFQPGSNVQELMAIFEKFSVLADEYTGIPRYMTGDSPAGGAGRTASGMSMLMSNASKSMKQVVQNVDTGVLSPLLERLYFHNMKYSDDMDLKGDIRVVARGAVSIIQKESAQVRRNEFLQTTANPFDMQIVGLEGRAAVLREVANTLDMPQDQVVPSPEKLRMKAMMLQAQQLAASQQAQMGGPSPSGQNLQDGSPTTDNFSPARH